MKIKQHKEKLEIIRDIIRETLLGNAALLFWQPWFRLYW
ncbi:Uncharacterised protein [Escherichia coli]|uniref:Uncharacterized protein n=1 Tax=Escherichia coli TaxID=562 RepID=A0A376VY54_ECOLX|nr:Uncharacterised protein [Escherichia coli]